MRTIVSHKIFPDEKIPKSVHPLFEEQIIKDCNDHDGKHISSPESDPGKVDTEIGRKRHCAPDKLDRIMQKEYAYGKASEFCKRQKIFGKLLTDLQRSVCGVIVDKNQVNGPVARLSNRIEGARQKLFAVVVWNNDSEHL